MWNGIGKIVCVIWIIVNPKIATDLNQLSLLFLNRQFSFMDSPNLLVMLTLFGCPYHK